MKWILRQIFQRVARGASTALRVVFADRSAWQAHQGAPGVMIVSRHVIGRAPDGTVELDGMMKGKL
jgi:hypothetical protein